MCKIFFPLNKIVSEGLQFLAVAEKFASRLRCVANIKYTLDVKDGRKGAPGWLS